MWGRVVLLALREGGRKERIYPGKQRSSNSSKKKTQRVNLEKSSYTVLQSELDLNTTAAVCHKKEHTVSGINNCPSV